MKNFILATATLFVGANLLGQTVPKGISYQAVAINTEAQSIAGINPENTYWSNKDIQVRFTIYDQYPGGSAQMVETHQTKTDKFGVFNLIIGQGQNESGDLFDVDWDKGQAHLKVEIDFNNNGLYKLVGIERFWSVPYALNSAGSTSGGGSGPDLSKKLDSLADALNKQIADFRNQINGDIANLNQGDTSSDNELQELELNGSDLGLSKSNKTVDISTILKDNDVTNELQSIRLSNDSLILSINNSGIKLPMDEVYDGDSSSTNELQNLKLMGDSLIITQGDTILLGSLIKEKSASQIFEFPKNTTMTDRSKTTYLNGVYGWTYIDTFSLVELKKGDKLKVIIPEHSELPQHSWVLIDESSKSRIKGFQQWYYQTLSGVSHFTYELVELTGGPRTTLTYAADKDIKVGVAMRISNVSQSGWPGTPQTAIKSVFVQVN